MANSELCGPIAAQAEKLSYVTEIPAEYDENVRGVLEFITSYTSYYIRNYKELSEEEKIEELSSTLKTLREFLPYNSREDFSYAAHQILETEPKESEGASILNINRMPLKRALHVFLEDLVTLDLNEEQNEAWKKLEEQLDHIEPDSKTLEELIACKSFDKMMAVIGKKRGETILKYHSMASEIHKTVFSDAIEASIELSKNGRDMVAINVREIISKEGPIAAYKYIDDFVEDPIMHRHARVIVEEQALRKIYELYGTDKILEAAALGVQLLNKTNDSDAPKGYLRTKTKPALSMILLKYARDLAANKQKVKYAVKAIDKYAATPAIGAEMRRVIDEEILMHVLFYAKEGDGEITDEYLGYISSPVIAEKVRSLLRVKTA
jgi:hypothetical protein